MSSVSITLDPTYTSVTGNPMVFAVSSTNIDEFQFQYVLDVRTSPDNTLRSRIKQFPNPEGIAIFDVSHICSDYIEYNPNLLTGSAVISPNTSEPSSSVTLFDGTGGVGVPAVTGSQLDGIYSAWGGTLDITPSSTGDGGGWNFGDYFNVTTGQYILSSLTSNILGPSPENHKVGRND
jgi:hypothetical protein